jgi:hypothetical protein
LLSLTFFAKERVSADKIKRKSNKLSNKGCNSYA